MSIYSGFSTRQQENIYGKLCEDLITVLATRVLKALKSEPVDDTIFSRTLVSIYSKMGKMELHKYLPPKLSQSCTKLAVFCTTIYPFSQNESIESFSKLEPELPLIQEVPVSSRKRNIRSNLQNRGKSNFSPVRAPSSSSYYEKVMEKYRKPEKNIKIFEKGTAECVQLNDGMFYRLM